MVLRRRVEEVGNTTEDTPGVLGLLDMSIRGYARLGSSVGGRPLTAPCTPSQRCPAHARTMTVACDAVTRLLPVEKSMSSPCSYFRLLPTVLLMTTLASGPLLAQDANAEPSGGGGKRMSRSAHDRRPSFDPAVMEGPPSPDSMTTIASLDDGQRARYANLYQNLMSATKSERD